MRNHYLEDEVKDAKEGDIIYFEMPPTFSGEYKAKIYKNSAGLYIHEEDNYIDSCRHYRVNKPYWK